MRIFDILVTYWRELLFPNLLKASTTTSHRWHRWQPQPLFQSHLKSWILSSSFKVWFWLRLLFWMETQKKNKWRIKKAEKKTVANGALNADEGGPGRGSWPWSASELLSHFIHRSKNSAWIRNLKGWNSSSRLKVPIGQRSRLDECTAHPWEACFHDNNTMAALPEPWHYLLKVWKVPSSCIRRGNHQSGH